jgi:hypothetical protein
MGEIESFPRENPETRNSGGVVRSEKKVKQLDLFLGNEYKHVLSGNNYVGLSR